MSLEQKLQSLQEREREYLMGAIDNVEQRYITMPSAVNKVDGTHRYTPRTTCTNMR